MIDVRWSMIGGHAIGSKFIFVIVNEKTILKPAIDHRTSIIDSKKGQIKNEWIA